MIFNFFFVNLKGSMMQKIVILNIKSILFCFFLISLSSMSMACTNAAIHDLAKHGNTKSKIAEVCGMSAKAVKAILKKKSSQSVTNTAIVDLPPGTPVGSCGCWGRVDPALRQSMEECANGYAVPQICRTSCPLGGKKWRGVCG